MIGHDCNGKLKSTVESPYKGTSGPKFSTLIEMLPL